MRNFKQLFCSCAVMAFALASFNANAESVDATAARAAAGKFLQQNRTARFMNSSMSNIKLIHAEKSDVKDNAYYVFNIDGGGWVVIAGDDRANEVLAYGTEGNLDMNNLPDNMKGYMKRYKNQVEFLQSGKMKASSLKAPKRVQAVEPLLKSVNWAQQGPFNLECPTYNGERSSVGCAALAMAQVVYYWKYPNDFPAIGSYQNSYSFSYVPALPARTIDYNLIRDQYATWETGSLGYVPGVTQEEKEEVAWLCRYCAQACRMNFSPDGSGSNVLKQKNAFLEIGYSTDARLLGIEAWPSRETWNTTDYTDEQWTAIMNEELAAGRPLPYSCEDFSIGHAFVVDGVDADGLYHVSWGWYGRGDGWFQHRAFNVTVQNEYMEFNDALFMVVDLYPYEGYVIPGDDEPEVTATPVLSYDQQTRMLTVEGVGEIHVYVDGVEVEMPYKFEKTFEVATYTVTATAQEEGKSISETALLVVTVPAKQLGDINDDGFVNVSDVTDLINAILNSETDSLDASVANINGDANINVSDVTDLIAMILNH